MRAASVTYKTVKARFWPCLSVKSPENLSSCSLFARKLGLRGVLKRFAEASAESRCLCTLADYPQVDTQSPRYKPVNFRAPRAPQRQQQTSAGGARNLRGVLERLPESGFRRIEVLLYENRLLVGALDAPLQHDLLFPNLSDLPNNL